MTYDSIRFRFHIPLSKKNNREWGGRRPKKAAMDAQVALQLALQAAVKGSLWPSEDVEVQIDLYPLSDAMEVIVRPLREKPKGKSGRRRDIASAIDVTLDAMQKAIYENDNQVARLVVERHYTEHESSAFSFAFGEPQDGRRNGASTTGSSSRRPGR